MSERTPLSEYSTDEILAEVERRRQEAQRLVDRLGSITMKSPAKSLAKAKFWSEWRTYKASHPGATLEQWQKARRKAK